MPHEDLERTLKGIRSFGAWSERAAAQVPRNRPFGWHIARYPKYRLSLLPWPEESLEGVRQTAPPEGVAALRRRHILVL